MIQSFLSTLIFWQTNNLKIKLHKAVDSNVQTNVSLFSSLQQLEQEICFAAELKLNNHGVFAFQLNLCLTLLLGVTMHKVTLELIAFVKLS